ncbi:uncharacterized protein UTRI_04171 [Ustilago trichophora]|uniref:Uncharacterized protein n=1 Tax=Ustilago trichophora TaxID=86804 RepID=A0A5C3E7T3_9BASI|nr:uncharacterized protein UTRI_04171 [Ustilago trichophora]
MQVATPMPSPAPHTLSPSGPRLGPNGLGSSDASPSPITNASPRRLRRSLRLSGAALSSPQSSLNKENVGGPPMNQPSTSAKTLDVGISESDKLSSSPRVGSPLSGSPALHSSPLRSRSSPIRTKSPLRRSQMAQSDDIVSSSDESDDSTLVFFGKPSSAEKKKRVHYEQRVLEKRLKHKDSLDLARRRPISFNPDDTMLVDDQHAFGWSWNKPTPTPSRTGMMLLSSPTLSSAVADSPSKGRSSTRNSSPDRLLMLLDDDPAPHRPSSLDVTRLKNLDTRESSEQASPEATEESPAGPETTQLVKETEAPIQVRLESQTVELKSIDKQDVNPFIVSRNSPVKDSAPKSPSKPRTESPRRAESPVRLIETLIGATMTHNRDLASPMRSPRRSPRLSVRALQLSTSPTKTTGSGLFFGPSTPFQQSLAAQQATPFQQSTPFQQPAAVQPVPPSTGLSRFACLQNLSSFNRAQETPANRALSMRMAHHAALPSPFISGGIFEPLAEALPIGAATHETPSLSPLRPLRAPSSGQLTPSPWKQSASVNEQAVDADPNLRGSSPSKAAPVPGTPSVRFVEPELHTTPSRTGKTQNGETQGARTPSPSKAQIIADVSRSLEQLAELQPEPQPSPAPARNGAVSNMEMPSTPPSAMVESNTETPGPVFRQTARRVPIHQHEADFGVKVSPEKLSYSPRKAHANSSARTNDFGAKQERIPARRVTVQSALAARKISGKQGEPSAPMSARVPSVASKAARTASAGGSRIGSQATSLSAAALSRTVSVPAAPTSATTSSATSGAATSGMATKQPATRLVASSQGPSVAPKASRLQRPASTTFGNPTSSPSKQTRSLSGLPRPKLAPPTASAAQGAGPGSRLPRPATLSATANAARPTSRPVPMAIARLAPAQQGIHRAIAASATPKPQAASPVSGSSVEAAPISEPSNPAQDEEMKDVALAAPEPSVISPEAEVTGARQPESQVIQAEEVASSSVPLRRQISSSALRVPAVRAEADAQPEPVGQVLQTKTARSMGRAIETAPARTSSPIVAAPPARPPSSARSAPPVMLDPEQQRLRCLAMQEKARNRTPKLMSSVSAPTSSDVEEPPSSEAGAAGSSPQANTVEQSFAGATGPTGAPSAAEALASKHAEAMDAASTTSAPSSAPGTATGTAVTASTITSSGRPLRSTRSASRPLTPSATRVPPSRGRALSLNDIIAARKIDVPLSLTDQLRLADTVNKKYNEKTLARYKITKVQRPYERPPSPERHDHEPEACTIIDDSGSHRQGKGDLAPYSTPIKGSISTGDGSLDGRKCVRWYRPLFVGKGAQYGIRASEARPALKPIQYELDRMGNKVATGNSPKLSKGQSIVIYRNYFKGEPEPADD